MIGVSLYNGARRVYQATVLTLWCNDSLLAHFCGIDFLHGSCLDSRRSQLLLPGTIAVRNIHSSSLNFSCSSMLKKIIIFPMQIDSWDSTFGTCSFTCFATCYSFRAGLVLAYPDSEQDRSVARTSTNILRVECGVRLTHEGSLQDVPTLTILQEPALV